MKILVDSMLDAIPNMFDSKVYVTYNRNYFLTNESHHKAKEFGVLANHQHPGGSFNMLKTFFNS